MAKSARERKADQIERERRELEKLQDSTYPFLKVPFYKWLEQNDSGDWSGVWHDLNAAGFDLPEFVDDSGPRSIDGEVERTRDGDYDPYAGFQGSIGRIESIIYYLTGAVQQMSMVVNEYKREQIEARIAELRSTPTATPEDQAKAVDEMVRLTKIRENLDKEVRLSLAVWSLKGELAVPMVVRKR